MPWLCTVMKSSPLYLTQDPPAAQITLPGLLCSVGDVPHLFPLVLTTSAFNSTSSHLSALKVNVPSLTRTQSGFIHVQLLVRVTAIRCQIPRTALEPGNILVFSKYQLVD